jgi:hypothetical protein
LSCGPLLTATATKLHRHAVHASSTRAGKSYGNVRRMPFEEPSCSDAPHMPTAYHCLWCPLLPSSSQRLALDVYAERCQRLVPELAGLAAQLQAIADAGRQRMGASTPASPALFRPSSPFLPGDAHRHAVLDSTPSASAAVQRVVAMLGDVNGASATLCARCRPRRCHPCFKLPCSHAAWPGGALPAKWRAEWIGGGTGVLAAGAAGADSGTVCTGGRACRPAALQALLLCMMQQGRRGVRPVNGTVSHATHCPHAPASVGRGGPSVRQRP